MSLRINYNDTELNKIVVTLQEDYNDILPIGGTYSLKFKFPDIEYTNDVLDSSENPTEFNIFNITTDINGGDFPMNKQGWCEYTFYYDGGSLETGKCYICVSDDVENAPSDIYTYERTTTEYIYNKDWIEPTPTPPPVDMSEYIIDEGEAHLIVSGMYIVL